MFEPKLVSKLEPAFVLDTALVRALGQLSRIPEIPESVFRGFESLFLSFVEIEHVDAATFGAGVVCRITVSEDNLNLLAAFLARNGFGDGEVPFHGDTVDTVLNEDCPACSLPVCRRQEEGLNRWQHLLCRKAK